MIWPRKSARRNALRLLRLLDAPPPQPFAGCSGRDRRQFGLLALFRFNAFLSGSLNYYSLLMNFMTPVYPQITWPQNEQCISRSCRAVTCTRHWKSNKCNRKTCNDMLAWPRTQIHALSKTHWISLPVSDEEFCFCLCFFTFTQLGRLVHTRTSMYTY